MGRELRIFNSGEQTNIKHILIYNYKYYKVNSDSDTTNIYYNLRARRWTRDNKDIKHISSPRMSRTIGMNLDRWMGTMGMRMMFKEGYHRQLTLARKREIMRMVQANKARISKTETTINSQSIKGHRTIRWDGKMGNKLIMDNKLMGMSNKGSSQTSQEYRKYSQISGITLTKMQSLNSSTQIKGEMLGDQGDRMSNKLGGTTSGDASRTNRVYGRNNRTNGTITINMIYIDSTKIKEDMGWHPSRGHRVDLILMQMDKG